MELQPIILVGPGGHAESCIDVIEQEGRYNVVGLVGLQSEVGSSILGYPVIGTDEDLPRLVSQVKNFLVTVGHIKTPALRIQLFETLLALGGELPTIVSPHAYVSRHALVGIGSIVMHGAVVNSGATVGRNCIINSLALVEHGVKVDDHCHVSTSAAVNSGVRIGRGTFIGSGSSIRQCLSIGVNCLIGLGQAVVADCPDGTQLPPRKETK
jgi:sugar O-acyltransferase (sialic acid O-acetyltransferase NeuD family)